MPRARALFGPLRLRPLLPLLPLIAWECLAAPSPAHAHAPLARALALAPPNAAGGSGQAVSAPGFGLVVRATEDAPFAYACDALLGLDPARSGTVWAYRADGALLYATASSLRALSAEGCPIELAASGLPPAPVVALAAWAGDADVMYAVTGGADPALQRSDDGGESWTRGAPLPASTEVSALLVQVDAAERVYVSQLGALAGESVLLVSDDAGDTFTSFEQPRVLRLLHVGTGASPELWATTPDAGIRGALMLRAEQPDGPWDQKLRVNFFGGFAIDASSTIWVGDEGGSLHRSSDDGDSFEEALLHSAVACLESQGDALFACKSGLTTMPALGLWDDAQQSFAKVVAFADVDRLVECAPELDVANVCAAAWNEWRVDVRGAVPPVVTPPPNEDAGAPVAVPAQPDAGQPEVPVTTPAPREHHASGCAVIASTTARVPWRHSLAPAALLLAGARRLRRRFARRYSKSEKSPVPLGAIIQRASIAAHSARRSGSSAPNTSSTCIAR